MGLAITAYKGLTKIDCVFDADREPIDPETREAIDYDFMSYVNPDFPERAEGIESRVVYKADDSVSFRAGSYGRYNAWREELAKLAGYPAVAYERYGQTSMRHDAGAWAALSGPFHELINFSDCEGVIGPVVSAKLAQDFADFQEKADSHNDEYFRSRYANWRQAFEMAAINGAVDFR